MQPSARTKEGGGGGIRFVIIVKKMVNSLHLHRFSIISFSEYQ